MLELLSMPCIGEQLQGGAGKHQGSDERGHSHARLVA